MLIMKNNIKLCDLLNVPIVAEPGEVSYMGYKIVTLFIFKEEMLYV